MSARIQAVSAPEQLGVVCCLTLHLGQSRVEAMEIERVEALVGKAVEMAMNGDTAAMRSDARLREPRGRPAGLPLSPF